MKPVCLWLHWLPNNEYRKMEDELSNFTGSIDISHFYIKSKDEAKEAISNWLGNNQNSQFLFIGAQGIKDESGHYIGLGSSENDNDFIMWEELWDWLGVACHPPVLWLCACGSSDAAKAWSPFSSSPKRVRWLVCFDTDNYTIEIKKILSCLKIATSINPIIYVNDQLKCFRKELRKIAIKLFFPAYTLNRQCEYVNLDKFEEEVGKTFKEFLKQQCC